MDYENLIERLKHDYHGYSMVENNPEEAFHDMVECLTSLSTLQAENKKLRAELEQVKRERDEAVEYLRGQCRYCKRNLVCTSRKGPHSNCWEWRGPQKED